jgi:hypothetical protein
MMAIFFEYFLIILILFSSHSLFFYSFFIFIFAPNCSFFADKTVRMPVITTVLSTETNKTGGVGFILILNFSKKLILKNRCCHEMRIYMTLIKM